MSLPFSYLPHYYRIAFAGLTDMASIELALKYRYGVVAYINGEEVYRDNMPAGTITATTACTGSYSNYEFRGLLRPAYVAEAASSVLAVEVHFPQNQLSVIIDFDGYLTFAAPAETGGICHVIPYDVATTQDGASNPEFMFSWNLSGSGTTFSVAGATVTSQFTGTIQPVLNGFRIWPYTTPATTVTDFTVEGMSGMSVGSGNWTTIMNVAGTSYTSRTWKQWTRITATDRLSHLRFTALASQNTPMTVIALQYLVCNVDTPNVITFPQTSYSYYATRETALIEPEQFGFSGCSVSPALPAGMSINPNTCVVSGVPSVAIEETTFTVTSQMEVGGNMHTATGQFTLTVTECLHSLYKLVRTYQQNPQYESFRIRNTADNSILYEVEANHAHPARATWEHFLCLQAERWDVSVYSTYNDWTSNSWLYVYYVLPAGEMEMVVKMRYDSYQVNDHTWYIHRPSVAPAQSWYYSMGNVPANWYAAETSATSSTWQQSSRGSFPASTNRIQLYKTTFTIPTLDHVSAIILSLRYRYGCVVYLNGHKAFRNGIEGTEAITATTQAVNSYTELRYRIITLPGKTMPADTSSSSPSPVVTYLQEGLNTIAIGLVALTDSFTTSEFDCMVRLTSSQMAVSHIWEFTTERTGFFASGDNLFDMHYTNVISSQFCSANHIIVTLDHDRREWVSSMHVQNYYISNNENPASFQVYARNGNEEWTLLKNVTNVNFSMAGQKRIIRFNNNKSFNQFKIANIAPASGCPWRVQSMNFYMNNMLEELGPLTYPATVTAIKGIEMAEVIPEADGYYDFSITPALPAGLMLDEASGWISGTATEEKAIMTYSITASKRTGGSVTVTLQLEVGICTNGRGLMTFRMIADSFKTENAWKLFSGRGTSGEVLQSVNEFPVGAVYYYLDFCLDDGIYTFQAIDTFGDGWIGNSGYTLTVDLGSLELEVNAVAPNNIDGQDATSSIVFSSYIPFQIGYTEWKVWQALDVAETWTSPSFDDNAWPAYKATAIPTTAEVTTYLRKSFTVANVEDYQVLNVHAKFAGGMACYFNGHLVARFNLPETFDFSTPATKARDASTFVKFHVILPTTGLIAGVNVIAFELHRAASQASSEPVVFDATGVFGVDDCSTVVDSYTSTTSSEVIMGSREEIFDLDPFTTGRIANMVGDYVEWTVENLVGSKWNAFNVLTTEYNTNNGFLFYGWFDPEQTDEANTIEMLDISNVTVADHTKPQIPVPVALGGFRKFRWQVFNAGSTTMTIGALFMAYCKASGEVCPAIDEFPAVAEGQISASVCPEGYSGFAYRECTNGLLGDIQMDHCRQRLPTSIEYKKPRYLFVEGIASTTEVPLVSGIVEKWYVDEGTDLPAGLVLNEQTGEIAGTPTAVVEMTEVKVYAENQAGVVIVKVFLQVRKGICLAEGVFETTEVGTTAVYECSSEGSYVGTMKRACKLGEVDGEWEKATGSCIAVAVMVVIILVALVVVIVIVWIIIRVSKKRKPVAGKKAGKTVMKKGAKPVSV